LLLSLETKGATGSAECLAGSPSFAGSMGGARINSWAEGLVGNGLGHCCHNVSARKTVYRVPLQYVSL